MRLCGCPLMLKTRVSVPQVTVGVLDSQSAYRRHISAALAGESRPYHALQPAQREPFAGLHPSALPGLQEPREALQGCTEDGSWL